VFAWFCVVVRVASVLWVLIVFGVAFGALKYLFFGLVPLLVSVVQTLCAGRGLGLWLPWGACMALWSCLELSSGLQVLSLAVACPSNCL